jgi:hypothetical protein
MTDSIHADTVVHPTPLEVLKGARELLADEERWTTKEYSRTAAGVGCNDPLSEYARRWCLAGAIAKASGRQPGDHEPAIRALAQIVREPGVTQPLGAIAIFNDDATHAEVLAVLDRAIAAASPQPESGT